MKTEAYGVTRAGGDLELMEIDIGEVQADQVRVEILYCGLCHTDIHMKNNDWGVSNFPLVPGHEGVGRVVDKGSLVRSLEVGDLVGIGWLRDSCRQCQSCSIGKENLCEKGYQGTYLASNAGLWGKEPSNLLGCFSRYMHINERFAFKLEFGETPLERIAPLMCAGVTVWEPIADYVKPGTKVGLIAFGGLGHMAYKFADAVGAIVSVLDYNDEKRAQATDLGVKEYINYNDAEEFKKASGKFDVLIDTCPVAHKSLAPFMGCLKFGGTYVRLGIPLNSTSGFTYDFIPLIFTGQKIAGSIVAGSTNTKNMLKVAATHHILSDVEVLPFSQVNEAMSRLVEGKVKGFRFVLKWNSRSSL